VRRTLAAALVVAATGLLAACSPAAEPEDSIDSSATSGAAASGTSPIVFAFVCRTGSSDRTETYTTYSAVWEDERTECTAERITGTEMSAQQADAVQAAGGAATLEELAAGCAVSGTAPWTAPVTDGRGASVAAGLLAYCPGHPDVDELRAAVATHGA